VPSLSRAASRAQAVQLCRRGGPGGSFFARQFAAAPAASFDVLVPNMGDSITEGALEEWLKDVGDYVEQDEVVCSIETDKVSVEVRSEHGGMVTARFAEVEDTVAVGAVLLNLDTTAAAPEKVEAAPEPAAAAAAPAAPAAAAAAAAPAPVAPAAPKAAPAAAAAAAPAPPAAGARGETRVKMNRMRLRIAERLKEAQNTAAMLTTFQECDMGNLMAMRTEYKDLFEKTHGVKLGFMSAFVAASAAGLVRVPGVNAMIDDEAKEIVYRDYVDISVAVATPKGLVTPVLRDCQSMSFADIEQTIAMYGAKAREGQIAMEDMVGGTFTISNGGVFGSLMGTPIINGTQSAILGMHGTKMRPMLYKGEIVARPMMYLALTYDHRVVDGREAVTFLKGVAESIEDPNRLLLKL